MGILKCIQIEWISMHINFIFWLVNTCMESSIYKSVGTSTFLPAKSDSDVMFCLQSYQGRIIDKSLVN